MKLTAPKQTTWWIAAIAGILGTLVQFQIIPIPQLYSAAGWLVVFAFFLLVLGTIFKQL